MHFSAAWVYLKVFARLAIASLAIASVFRLLLWIGFYSKAAPLGLDLVQAFIAGVRFDLLVNGFFWLAFLVLIWTLTIFKKSDLIFNLSRLYWMAIQTLWLMYALSEIYFVAATGHRINSQFSQIQPAELFPKAFQQQNAFLLLFLTAAHLVAAIWLYRRTLAIRPILTIPETSGRLLHRAGIVILSFLFAGLAARGTVSAHHLRYEDVLVSDNPFLNQIPLNPIWSQDKDIVFEVRND